jgi:hypothetical protein
VFEHSAKMCFGTDLSETSDYIVKAFIYQLMRKRVALKNVKICINTLRTGIFFLYIYHRSLIRSEDTFL